MADDDVIRIPLRARDGSVRAWAIVDREDADLAELKWSLHGDGYAGSRGVSIHQGYLHRIILSRSIGRQLVDGEQCDHINRAPLDNRRCNLRASTARQNQTNRRSAVGSTSKYLGVSWDSGRSMWRADIYGRHGHPFLGRFADEDEAARAYDRAATQSYGEFASLNFPDGGDA